MKRFIAIISAAIAIGACLARPSAPANDEAVKKLAMSMKVDAHKLALFLEANGALKKSVYAKIPSKSGPPDMLLVFDEGELYINPKEWAKMALDSVQPKPSPIASCFSFCAIL